MSRTTRLIPLAVAVMSVAALAVPATASAGGRPLHTELTGAEEVAPADPDGAGTFHAWVNPGQTEVCYELSVSGLAPDTIVGAHIHQAPVGVAGPIVVPLTSPVSGTSSGCVQVERDLAVGLVSHPSDYYVNVHTDVYRAGAIRGQLG